MTNDTIKVDFGKDRAVEASKPGKFNFLDRLADRNYAVEEVEINLDERAGHEIEQIRIALADAKADEVEALELKLAEVRERAKESRYVVTLQGISNESYDAIVDLAQAEFPVEYRESRNPLTMAIEREVVDNQKREQFFRVHLWSKFITKITAPDGSVDEDINPELVGALVARAPIAALGSIAFGVQNLRMITDWMDHLQDEGFLAKS